MLQIYIGTRQIREWEKKNTQDFDIWTKRITCDASLCYLGHDCGTLACILGTALHFPAVIVQKLPSCEESDNHQVPGAKGGQVLSFKKKEKKEKQ